MGVTVYTAIEVLVPEQRSVAFNRLVTLMHTNMDDLDWNYSNYGVTMGDVVWYPTPPLQMRLTNHSHRYKPPSQKSFTKLTMVATITVGWVPLVMVISISNTKELYYSTNRTTMVVTIVLTIVPIEVALYC